MYHYPCVQKIQQIQLPTCMYTVRPITIVKQEGNDQLIMSSTQLNSNDPNNSNYSNEKSVTNSVDGEDERELLSTLAKQEKLIQRILQLEKQVNLLTPAPFRHGQSNGEPFNGSVTQVTTGGTMKGEIASSRSLADSRDAVSMCPVYPKVVQGILDRQEKLILSIDQLTQQIEKRVNLSSSNSGTFTPTQSLKQTVHPTDHKLVTCTHPPGPKSANVVQSVKQRMLDVALHVNFDDPSDYLAVQNFLKTLPSFGFNISVKTHILHTGRGDANLKLKNPSAQWNVDPKIESRSQCDLTVTVIFHKPVVGETVLTNAVRAVLNPSSNCIEGSKSIIQALAKALLIDY